MLVEKFPYPTESSIATRMKYGLHHASKVTCSEHSESQSFCMDYDLNVSIRYTKLAYCIVYTNHAPRIPEHSDNHADECKRSFSYIESDKN